MRAPCSIEGCEQESRGRGWCGTHWRRWRNHGDPLFVKKSGVDFNVKGVCSIVECGRPLQAQTFCNMHYTRFMKHGDPSIIAPRLGRPLNGDIPTFAAIHKRLSRKRGPARLHSCIDCGGTAQEWSYNHADPSPAFGIVRHSRVPYSLDINNYDPRCIKCHRVFDLAGVNRERNELGQFTAA